MKERVLAALLALTLLLLPGGAWAKGKGGGHGHHHGHHGHGSGSHAFAHSHGFGTRGMSDPCRHWNGTDWVWVCGPSRAAGGPAEPVSPAIPRPWVPVHVEGP